jgi:3-phosphoshikimate 1-carboxyvinyltransferase
VCAALIVEGSEILVPNIGLNPTRNGLFTTLIEMGADITFENEREEGGEPVADLRIKYSDLTGVEVPPERAPTMIDEYPILSVVASFATGKTVMRGVKELRVKECDRIDAMARGLENMGVTIEEGEDFMIVHGQAGEVRGGGTAKTHLDHRIAMSFMCMGLATQKPVSIDDGGAIATSFPIFESLMGGLNAHIERKNS